MSNTGFCIGQAAIKDMSEEDLQKTATQLAGELQMVGETLNRCIQQMQVSTAMLNVVKYEIDRRANSIQIARLIHN